MKPLFCLVALIFTACPVAFAQNCPTGGTTIFFGNGILTTQDHADSTLNTLRIAVDHALDQKAPSRDPSCVQYRLAYDARFFDQGGVLATVGNALFQLAEAAVQAGLTDRTSEWNYLYQNSGTVPSLPDSGNSIATEYINLNSIVSTVQPDVQQHQALYEAELTSGNNVIVVAHSQGNFYVNQAYGLIAPPTGEFSTIALATPADNVIGTLAPPACGSSQTQTPACYLTLSNDIILLVAKLSGNTINTNNPDRCDSAINLASRTRCHDVDKSYFLGNVTGPAIIDGIVTLVLSDLTVAEDGGGTGTVTSTPSGIDCGLNCSASFYTNSTVSLAATPDPGSRFGGWSGDCTGTSLTTSVKVTANMSCTATFTPSLPAVRLNPFGNQSGAGPYNVEVVDQNLALKLAPGDITVTLLREVISQCSGLLFSSNRTVVVSQGQSSASYNFNAGHDPACNTLPITTRYTITGANLSPNQVLDLSGIPSQQLILAVTR